jgi:hypothetical protein
MPSPHDGCTHSIIGRRVEYLRIGIVLQQTALHEHEMICCRMALGYADDAAAVNSLRSDRAPVEEFASFRGFQ